MRNLVFILSLKSRLILVGGSGYIGNYLHKWLGETMLVEILGNNDGGVGNLAVLQKYKLKDSLVIYLANRKSTKEEDGNLADLKKFLDYCLKHRPIKIIYFSTVMVMSREKSTDSDYVKSKRRCLRLIGKYISKLPITVVYPGIVVNRSLIDERRRLHPWWKWWRWLGMTSQGGVMMRAGRENRILAWIYIDELAVMTEGLLEEKGRKEVVAVTKVATAMEYVNLGRLLGVSFAPKWLACLMAKGLGWGRHGYLDADMELRYRRA